MGVTLNGYKGKIVSRNGIITPNDEGGGTFKAFSGEPSYDIYAQYGGGYFKRGLL